MYKNLVAAAWAATCVIHAAVAATPAQANNASPPLEVGFVYVGSVKEPGWSRQHDLGRQALEKKWGAQVRTRFVENVSEGADAERVIRELAQSGSQLIFTTSFGYMEPTLRVAKDFPQVKFESITGYKTADNVATANARYYEGRYLAGMVAGRMTRTHVAGYIAAFPIPEVLQGINAFTLGMRAVNPKATVKVLWLNNWFDPAREREAAITLMDQGADVMLNHTASAITAQVAEERGRMSIGYHSDMRAVAPKGMLTSVSHHWDAYYTQVTEQVLKQQWKSHNVWGGIADGFVKLEGFNAKVPAKVITEVKKREHEMAKGKFHPFTGPLLDVEGRERAAPGVMSDNELLNMNWFVQGVIGTLPKSAP